MHNLHRHSFAIALGVLTLPACSDRPLMPASAATQTPSGTPRLLYPPVATRVSSHKPHLAWVLPTGASDVTLQLCATRACTTPTTITTLDADKAGATLAALAPGRIFWRVLATTDGAARASATWYFDVGARDVGAAANSAVFDYNGDGYADLLIGAPGFDSTLGQATLVAGAATIAAVTPTTIDAVDPAEPNGTLFGFAVANANDVNGDGLSDFVIGASAVADGRGRAYIYLGAATAPTTPQISLISPGDVNAFFGAAVAGIGDVNGDGYDDVAVGAYGANGNDGRVYVYYGSANGLSETPNDTLIAPDGGSFGYDLAGGADVDGDGLCDLVVGAPLAGNTYLFLGTTSGIAKTPAITLSQSGTNQFATAVSIVGDIDGDGYADLAFGVPLSSAVYLYRGRPTFADSALVALAPQGVASLMRFGASLAPAGDYDGDGRSDFFVGANGAAALITQNGGTLSPVSSQNATTTGDAAVGTASDIDGDGVVDSVVGFGDSVNDTGVVIIGFANDSNPAAVVPGENVGDRFGHSVAR